MITQDIINKSLLIHSNTEQYNYKTVIKHINQAKQYLQNRPIIKGQQVLIKVTEWPSFLIWFFACAELGLIVVTVDNDNLKDNQKLKVYGDIDIVITDVDAYTSYSAIPIPYLISPKDILFRSTSSGTTDDPKVVSYTHEFCCQILHRNAKLYNLESIDSCLHTKALQHGSILCVYLLPTISYCSNHYCSTSKDWRKLTSTITRCLLYYDMLDSKPLPNNDRLVMYTLTPINPALIKNQNIYSIFGCIETSGPLFLPKLPIQNNCFGALLDDFFKITINNSILTVELPNKSIITTGDQFYEENGQYFFEGRYSKNIADIISKLEKTGLTHQKQFDIVHDLVYNKIYLRLDTDTNINVDIKVIEPRTKFMYGIKFDASYFRDFCRGLL